MQPTELYDIMLPVVLSKVNATITTEVYHIMWAMNVTVLDATASML